jgi:endoglucanase Acf2
MRWLVGFLTALAVLAGCSAAPAGPAGAPSTPAAAAPAVLADAQVEGLVGALPQRTPKQLSAPRLADGLTPPTNRWYSGLVFGDQPQPVFPLPLGFGLTADGFALGLPQVNATADTIAGGFTPAVTVGLGAKSAVVTSDDPSVVVLENRDADGRAIGRTTLAQGSPFVSWVAAKEATVTLPEGFSPAGDGLLVATLDGTRYALATTKAEVSGASARVEAGGRLVFWPVPEGREPAELVAAAGHVPTGSTLGYQVADDTVTTTLTYATDGDSAIARMPHQGTDGDCGLGSYPSVYGTMPLCAGSAVTWTTPRTPAVAALGLDRVTGEQRDELTRQLDTDLAKLPDFPADTYFGGKALQRTAMLLMVADQLKLTDRAEALASVLDEQLATWTDPKGCEQREAFCFVYDPEGKGLVGLTPSFGSDEYNDHHFHYGYFLYAAGVLAGHDPAAAERYAPVMNLVAADIASAGNRFFPDRRAFDAYAGHSWASGTSPFADGNNQESVSEAVNAYAGLSLWAGATGDQALAAEADWMLSLEAHSSGAYWLQPDLSAFPGYQHRITVLNWGGKRDYATWFSPEPAAKLGILLLPMSPTSTYLRGDAEAIRANVAEAVGTRFDQKFGDYLLMYAALAGPDDRDRAVEAARKLADGNLDDGMSRTYLMAWLYSLRF